ncbi:MAG TPA: glucose 1-dehydrogenase [Aggregatilineales bacterium]|nr:glucose 1-dehydrogenase [Aggregatilineales bacterium]
MTERRRPLDHEFEMPSLRLDGRVALVTGGSRGLGLGMALALAHVGADIILAARTIEQLENGAKLVEAIGCRAHIIQTDVGDMNQVRQMVKDAAAFFGRLDILVNGAGINIRKPMYDFTEDDFDYLMSINLKSVFFASQEAAKIMREQGKGKIIHLGSLSFEIVIPNIGLYATSKGGMRQLTKAMAMEWANDNICVNAIAPGRFWTEMTDRVFSVPELYDSAVSIIPQGRPGIPSDLAGATVLLASDAGDYITGQTIVVDGGWLINGGVKG